MSGRERPRSPMKSIRADMDRLEELGAFLCHKLPGVPLADCLVPAVWDLFADDFQRQVLRRRTPALVMQSISKGWHTARVEQADALRLVDDIRHGGAIRSAQMALDLGDQ